MASIAFMSSWLDAADSSLLRNAPAKYIAYQVFDGTRQFHCSREDKSWEDQLGKVHTQSSTIVLFLYLRKHFDGFLVRYLTKLHIVQLS